MIICLSFCLSFFPTILHVIYFIHKPYSGQHYIFTLIINYIQGQEILFSDWLARYVIPSYGGTIAYHKHVCFGENYSLCVLSRPVQMFDNQGIREIKADEVSHYEERMDETEAKNAMMQIEVQFPVPISFIPYYHA